MSKEFSGEHLGPNEAMDDDQLSREADFFHQKIFKRSIPEQLRVAYISANRMLLKEASHLSNLRIDLILERSMDVEAIEFALRRRAPQNLLTKKLLILCYLAESRSDYFTTFVNERHQPVRAVFKLALHTFRSLYKLLKGLCLIRIYNVV